MDLLGSILGSMEKPPTLDDKDRKKAREQKKQQEKLQEREREQLEKFRSQMQKKMNDFIKDSTQEKLKTEAVAKVFRAIIHEVADVAGLTSFSFGQEEIDRYVMIWKKEYAPTDEELAAYRRGEEYNPEKAKEDAKLKEQEEEDISRSAKEKAQMVPKANFQDKYDRLIGKESAKDAAKITSANKSYGFVPSENKRDLRTIEQVMDDNRAKRLKTSHNPEPDSSTDVLDNSQISLPEDT